PPPLALRPFPPRRSSDLSCPCSWGSRPSPLALPVWFQATLALQCSARKPPSCNAPPGANAPASTTPSPSSSAVTWSGSPRATSRSEEHTSELQSPDHLVC